jgi:hypothetical protein
MARSSLRPWAFTRSTVSGFNARLISFPGQAFGLPLLPVRGRLLAFGRIATPGRHFQARNSQYDIIGYTPPSHPRDGGFHSIEEVCEGVCA